MIEIIKHFVKLSQSFIFIQKISDQGPFILWNFTYMDLSAKSYLSVNSFAMHLYYGRKNIHAFLWNIHCLNMSWARIMYRSCLQIISELVINIRRRTSSDLTAFFLILSTRIKLILFQRSSLILYCDSYIFFL